MRHTNIQRILFLEVLLAGCTNVSGTRLVDAEVLDAGLEDSAFPRVDAGDAGPNPCVPMDLGGVLGEAIATGSSAGGGVALTFSCASLPSPQVYYTWTAPSAGTFVFDTRHSSFDTVLGLFGGCSGSAELRCDDESGSYRTSWLTYEMSAGQTVLVAVRGYRAEDVGNYELSIRPYVAENCTGAMDEDFDGFVDCSDFDCEAQPGCVEVCTDGIDNDTDDDVDCDDSDCRDDSACIEDNCTDGADNEGDGDIDCVDYDCANVPACLEVICDDGMDNDMDGHVDCADFNCRRTPLCHGEVDCNNRIDDDGDRLIDCGDPDCQDHCRESRCGDGRDGDWDGLTDCADEECVCDDACRPPVPMCPSADLGSAVGTAVGRGILNFLACGGTMTSCGNGSGGETTYRWTAPSAGTYTFSTVDPETTFDTILEIRSACDSEALDCIDDASGAGLQSRVSIPMMAGQTVLIVIDSMQYDHGNFVLSIAGPG